MRSKGGTDVKQLRGTGRMLMSLAALVVLGGQTLAQPVMRGGAVNRGHVPMAMHRIHPVDQAMMNLRQLEMTAFLSPRSRMALTEARFDMQSVAWRTQRGFPPSGFELDRIAGRLRLVAADPNLSPFDRMRLSDTVWALRDLRFGGVW
jgi:hypothetical protein